MRSVSFNSCLDTVHLKGVADFGNNIELSKDMKQYEALLRYYWCQLSS